MGFIYNVIDASCKGNSPDHRYQDHRRVAQSDSCLIAVVADGLGSAIHSDRGSGLICQILTELTQIIDWGVNDIEDTLNTCVSEWYRRLEIKKSDPHDCCTTCSVVIMNKLSNIAYLCYIGDSPIFYRADGESVKYLSTNNEFINETECLGSSHKPIFVINTISFSKSFDFLIASDGFGDEIILESSDALFDYFIQRYSKIRKSNRNHELKSELASTMQDKNNDDKSLIFCWIYGN